MGNGLSVGRFSVFGDTDNRQPTTDFVRALRLGELLVLAALVVLAPLIRAEDGFSAAMSSLPANLAGESYYMLMLGLLGVLVSARALAAGRLTLPEPGTALALGLYVGYVAIRGTYSDHPFEARHEAACWLGHFLLFALALLTLGGGGAGARRVLLAAVAASLVLESARAIFDAAWVLPKMREQVLGGAFDSEINLHSPLAMWRVMAAGASNSFLTPNQLGSWLASAALAGAGLFAGYLAARRSPETQRRPWLLVVSALAALGLFAVAFRLAGSKGAALALAGALAGSLLAIPPAMDVRWRRWLRAAGGAALAGLILLGILYGTVPRMPGRAELRSSARVRLGYWRAAATMAAEHPLAGVGPGTFGARYPALKRPLDEESQYAHNAWLETAAEEGLPGLALLAAFWGLVLWRLGRRPDAAEALPDPPERRKQLAAVLVVGIGALVAFALLRFGRDLLIMNALPAVWAAGLALAGWPLFVARREEPRPEAAERLLRWGIFAALAAFLLHCTVDFDMSMRTLVGPALLLAALGLAGAGRRELVLDGRKALVGALLTAVLAGAALWLGFREGRRAEAIAAIEEPPPEGADGSERCAWTVERVERAVAVDPFNPTLRLCAASIETGAANAVGPNEEGHRLRARAEAHLEKAVQLAPARTTPRRHLARYRLMRGQFAPAAADYEKLLALYPLKAQMAIEWGDAELLAGDALQAARLYRQALETSRLVGDPAIHLSMLFEDPNGQLGWERPMGERLAAALDAALVADPDNAALLVRRGLVETARAADDRALAYFKRAAAAEPLDAGLALFEGYGWRLVGEWETALERMRAAGILEGKPGARPAAPGAVERSISWTLAARQRERAEEARRKKERRL